MICKIKIIGLGPGDVELLSCKGKSYIEKSNLIIGNQRHIESVQSICLMERCVVLNKITEIAEILKNELAYQGENRLVSVIVSGDTGFYSLLDYIMRSIPSKFHENIEVIPAISSFQYMFGKLKKCWHNYLLVSLHGRDLDFIPHLNFSKDGIVMLTDKHNNWKTISKKLIVNNLNDIQVIIGENLSYENEKIYSFKVSQYESYNFSTDTPSVIVLEKRSERCAHI